MQLTKIIALLALSASSASSAVLAVERVTVLGLFSNKAVMVIDGKQRTLALNQTSPEGVTLISADSESAILEIAGKRSTHRLGSQSTATPASATRQTTVQIFRNPQGMYTSTGSINGFPVDFLVDTGATNVAMNAPQAKRLGIDFRLNGEPSWVSTAAGIARAYEIRLRRVKLGDIELNDIDAVVLEGDYPTDVLLGMSFLGRLELMNSGDLMQLKRKH